MNSQPIPFRIPKSKIRNRMVVDFEEELAVALIRQLSPAKLNSGMKTLAIRRRLW